MNSWRRWRSVLALVCALWVTLPATAATLLRSPYLQNVQADQASILWTTQEAGSGAVTITGSGTTRNIPAAVRLFPPAETHLAESFCQYEANLTGLQPGTSYDYKVLVDGKELAPASASSLPLHFTTAGPGRFSFLAFGDSGSGSPAQHELASRMASEPDVSFVIHTGDIAYEQGTFSQFESRYFAIYASLMSRVPFFPTPGNHEYYTDFGAAYLAVHAFPDSGAPAEDKGRYYSYDWGNAHFVSVDSNLHTKAESERMMDWLERDLQRTSKFWKIVYFHHTPYPSGYHLDDTECALALAIIVPVVERNGVQLVLNGHEHSYQRSFPLVNGHPVEAGAGTTYINTSGGGAWLQSIGHLATTSAGFALHNFVRVDLDGGELTVHAVSLDGSELDKVTIAPKPAIKAVVNSVDFGPGLAPGSLISIFGQNLSFQVAASDGAPDQVLNGTRVTLDGTPIPLLYVSPSQINAQLPFRGTGPGAVRIENRNGVDAASITLADVAPAILLLTTGNTTLAPDRPVAPGTSITVVATGLGPVNGSPAAGAPAPAPALPVVDAVRVIVGGITLVPSLAALTPGAIGLYEVELSLPPLPSGIYSVQLDVGGVKSQPVPILLENGPSPLSRRRLNRK